MIVFLLGIAPPAVVSEPLIYGLHKCTLVAFQARRPLLLLLLFSFVAVENAIRSGLKSIVAVLLVRLPSCLSGVLRPFKLLECNEGNPYPPTLSRLSFALSFPCILHFTVCAGSV